MRKRTRISLIVTAAIIASFLVPAIAGAAATSIYVSKGIGGATLGMTDTTAAKKIGKVVKKGRDSSYEGQTVYYFYFGKKSGGRYAVEMYSNAKHKVFTFVINSSAYKTTNGVGVGSSESTLKKKYPSLRKYKGSVYTRYTIGGKTGTDFYVKSAKVHHIVIRTY